MSSDFATVAHVERAQLCDLLDAVGPHAPTLCSGWDTAHLVAHLVVREGSPLALLSALRPKTGRQRLDDLLREREFAALVADLRAGPPRTSLFGTALTDRLGNGLEYFVHHEDVRRARPGFEVRELPLWAADSLWQGVGFAARALLRKAPVGVALRRTDNGSLAIGAKKPGAVIVAGAVPELALFAFGRGAVADVSFDGAPDDVATLRATSFPV